MSSRLELSVYKEVEQGPFLARVEEIVVHAGGKVSWDDPREDWGIGFSTSHSATVQTLYLPYANGSGKLLASRIAKSFGCIWMSLRIQEDSFWDYVLARGDKHLDQFSTLPQYWSWPETNREQQQNWRGQPAVLAETWGIPQRRIEKYLMNWGMRKVDDIMYETILKGKAYASDECVYGDYSQMFDFLAALGGSDPNFRGRFHRIDFPPKEKLQS